MAVKIAFLGGGNMASALIGGLLGQGWSPSDLAVTDIDPAARARLSAGFGVRAEEDPRAALTGSDCAVLAVKPQQLAALVQPLAADLAPRLVVSIAAGIRTPDLSRWLDGHRRLVRAMPNTPALLRAGVSAAFATDGVSETDRAGADALLAAVGKVLWVRDESLLDGVTAVSGSGPAYAFYLVEAMQEAARQLGFSEAEGRLLSVQTLLGAARLAEASEETAATLRARVTSRGGTTERAISVMDGHHVREHLVEAVLAAAQRSRELGDALGSG